MRVLVYEHLTASGDDDGSSMYCEGRAMRDALVADLHAIPGVEVVEERPDVAFVIAPETDGILEGQVARFRMGCPVIAPSPESLALTRDKLALAGHWLNCKVPTPHTTLANDWPPSRRPAVVKPRDGAGSCETVLVCEGEIRSGGIAQDFVPGRAASVAFLIKTRQTIPLLPTFQHLSDDGRFHYLGGELPTPESLARRAIELGRRAIECVPGLAGYIGVDLILGDSPDGREDCAIEINPRLTTSYIGLRSLADFNIAAALLALFRDESIGERKWKPGRVAFTSDGTVKHTMG